MEEQQGEIHAYNETGERGKGIEIGEELLDSIHIFDLMNAVNSAAGALREGVELGREAASALSDAAGESSAGSGTIHWGEEMLRQIGNIQAVTSASDDVADRIGSMLIVETRCYECKRCRGDWSWSKLGFAPGWALSSEREDIFVLGRSSKQVYSLRDFLKGDQFAAADPDDFAIDNEYWPAGTGNWTVEKIAQAFSMVPDCPLPKKSK